jgi:hypothetical protein
MPIRQADGIETDLDLIQERLTRAVNLLVIRGI